MNYIGTFQFEMRGKLLKDENLVEDGLLPKAAPAGKMLFVARNVLGTSVSHPLFLQF